MKFPNKEAVLVQIAPLLVNPAIKILLSFFLGFRRPNLITGLSGW